VLRPTPVAGRRTSCSTRRRSTFRSTTHAAHAAKGASRSGRPFCAARRWPAGAGRPGLLERAALGCSPAGRRAGVLIGGASRRRGLAGVLDRRRRPAHRL
jgi:hypothetical protein